MALLVDIIDQNWLSNESFAQFMCDKFADDEIRYYPDLQGANKITMLATDRLRPGLIKQLPNIRLVQKLGAGVDSMVFDPDLGKDVRIARLKHQDTADEMARFCLAYVLQDVHNLVYHSQHQAESQWRPIAPKKPRDVTVGVLGLGHIGGTTARLMQSMGFNVLGWSRTQREIENVHCFSGSDSVDKVLQSSDFVICILPSTVQTKDFFNYNRFTQMRPNATLINVGRGTLIVEQDLVSALDRNLLGHAVMDVFQNEPLAKHSPLWRHPKVTVTPHVSGWDLLGGMNVIAQNYRRLQNNETLLNEVDRNAGY